jgi:hypothetical protein
MTGDPEGQAVRESVLIQLAGDPERWLREYTNRFGNVLNADDAATLFDGYNKDRARFRVAVHPAATWIRDELFRRSIAEPAPAGKQSVVFTAGSNAAGKSTALSFTGVEREALVVFDSTLSNPAHARTLIGQALAVCRPVTILYIDRPLDDALLATLERGRREGRLVTIEQLIHSHRGAAETLRLLWHDFRNDPRFALRFIANSSAGAQEGSIELAHPRDYTRISELLYELLDSEYRLARISRAAYERVGGGGQRIESQAGE